MSLFSGLGIILQAWIYYFFELAFDYAETGFIDIDETAEEL